MTVFSVMFGFLSLCVCLLIGFWFVVTIRFLYNRPCLLWGLLLPGWAELGPGAAACGTGFWDWRWPVDGQLVCGADSLEWGLQNSAWHPSVSKLPRWLPLVLLFPRAFPVVSCLSGRLASASGSDPGVLKITAPALGLRVCEIWKAQSVSCSPSALPYSSPAGLQC